jgi:hypothetical protein
MLGQDRMRVREEGLRAGWPGDGQSGSRSAPRLERNSKRNRDVPRRELASARSPTAAPGSRTGLVPTCSAKKASASVGSDSFRASDSSEASASAESDSLQMSSPCHRFNTAKRTRKTTPQTNEASASQFSQSVMRLFGRESVSASSITRSIAPLARALVRNDQRFTASARTKRHHAAASVQLWCGCGAMSCTNVSEIARAPPERARIAVSKSRVAWP